MEVLVDVRAWPTSRIAHFKREEMEKWLAKSGIGYVWLGKELGGYRPGGYERYMETTDFEKGIQNLISIAASKRVCICCKERDPRYCHRRFIVRRLLREGFTVIHIIKLGRAYEAKLLTEV